MSSICEALFSNIKIAVVFDVLGLTAAVWVIPSHCWFQSSAFCLHILKMPSGSTSFVSCSDAVSLKVEPSTGLNPVTAPTVDKQSAHENRPSDLVATPEFMARTVPDTLLVPARSDVLLDICDLPLVVSLAYYPYLVLPLGQLGPCVTHVVMLSVQHVAVLPFLHYLHLTVCHSYNRNCPS